ncbi:glyoxalase/bleomycin resistance protein/dioxygenase [Paenibacillus alvei TS-15]|uniref:Glyoxalase/bleomycin resistance protein/dioxygenase n=1 Tax=Paenibacillus alvei TS-15 TaxID=1117108 RepID=S9UCL5_PAEAL|nr:VOC family protein [Paenibacillus alvei]EPY08195.1 glyoxalase/bleomycin resistance protein/dioxygenase [Paenibacillus alvei TS-15]
MTSTSASFACCLQMFPTPDLHRTAEYYENLGFRSVYYLESAEPHVCLYRDAMEIVLTKGNPENFKPNRLLHGYGYDGYFITTDQQGMLEELTTRGVKIVRPLTTTDYNNREFVFEDVDGRWIAVGMKQS